MAKECADMRPTEAVLWAVDREDKPLAPTWAACRAAISPAWGVAMLEVVHLAGGDVLLVDEEGLRKGLPHNLMASLVARRTIVGDAVFVPHALVSRVLGGDEEDEEESES